MKYHPVLIVFSFIGESPWNRSQQVKALVPSHYLTALLDKCPNSLFPYFWKKASICSAYCTGLLKTEGLHRELKMINHYI